MIHAYLFVTKNNKDRDGHGPEFTKVSFVGCGSDHAVVNFLSVAHARD